MKIIKDYGMYDLIQWKGIIPCANGAKLHVEFSGGSFSTNGTVPAKYRTDNIAIQTLIEGSEWFKRGRIKLVRKYVTEQDVTTTATTPKVAEETKAVATTTTAETPNEGKKELEHVTVADLEGEGRNYLKEHFGVPYNQVRSLKNIISVAEANGIVFDVE